MNILIIILQLLIIFFTSKIVSAALYSMLFYITRRHSYARYMLSITLFPGILTHEISHWIVAKILFVRTGRIEFVPVMQNGKLKLGSVQIYNTNKLKRLLIGIAPIFVGLIMILSLASYSVSSLLELSFTPKKVIFFFFVVYVLFVITNTMFSSKKDVEGSLALIILLLLTLGSLYIFNPTNMEHLLFQVYLRFKNFIDITLLLLLLPLSVNLIFIVLFYAWKKKVIA